MHPAVRSMIDGNISIIRHCLAQVEGALSAEDSGYQTALETRKQRHDTQKDGADQIYLDDQQDGIIQEGINSMFDEMKQEMEPNEQSEFQPAK